MWCGEEKVRTARKPHRCNWCGEDIKARERHYAWPVSEDGQIWTVFMHFECQYAMWREGFGEWDLYENPRGLTNGEFADMDDRFYPGPCPVCGSDRTFVNATDPEKWRCPVVAECLSCGSRTRQFFQRDQAVRAFRERMIWDAIPDKVSRVPPIPCPECGFSALRIRYNGSFEGHIRAWVECATCDSAGEPGNDVDDAVRQWNEKPLRFIRVVAP